VAKQLSASQDSKELINQLAQRTKYDINERINPDKSSRDRVLD
jgi:hypothetical protein